MEFGSEFDNSMIFKDGMVYINAELLAAITDKSFFSETEALILYAQPVTIKSIVNRPESVSITLDRDVLPDFSLSGGLEAVLQP